MPYLTLVGLFSWTPSVGFAQSKKNLLLLKDVFVLVFQPFRLPKAWAILMESDERGRGQWPPSGYRLVWLLLPNAFQNQVNQNALAWMVGAAPHARL